MCIFTFLLFDAYGGMGTINLGILSVNVFVLLAALLGAWTFMTATYALPWRWSATSVTVISLLFVGIVAIYVPPATNLLLQLEHLAFRRPGPHLPVVAVDWPAAFIVSAIIIDLLSRRARAKGWSARKQTLIIGASALIGFLPVPIILPFYPVFLVGIIGVVGFVVSLFLGLCGAYVGSWLGRNMGESMYSLER